MFMPKRKGTTSVSSSSIVYSLFFSAAGAAAAAGGPGAACPRSACPEREPVVHRAANEFRCDARQCRVHGLANVGVDAEPFANGFAPGPNHGKHACPEIHRSSCGPASRYVASRNSTVVDGPRRRRRLLCVTTVASSPTVIHRRFATVVVVYSLPVAVVAVQSSSSSSLAVVSVVIF